MASRALRWAGRHLANSVTRRTATQLLTPLPSAVCPPWNWSSPTYPTVLRAPRLAAATVRHRPAVGLPCHFQIDEERWSTPLACRRQRCCGAHRWASSKSSRADRVAQELKNRGRGSSICIWIRAASHRHEKLCSFPTRACGSTSVRVVSGRDSRGGLDQLRRATCPPPDGRSCSSFPSESNTGRRPRDVRPSSSGSLSELSI